jgi:hypothetical protein
LSNIRFQYGVYISLAYSSPFSNLSFVRLLVTWWSTSKSNCHCKHQVTIQFLFFHHPSSLESIVCSIVLTTSTTETSNTFYHTPLHFRLKNKITHLNPFIYSIITKIVEKPICYCNRNKNCSKKHCIFAFGFFNVNINITFWIIFTCLKYIGLYLDLK